MKIIKSYKKGLWQVEEWELTLEEVIECYPDGSLSAAELAKLCYESRASKTSKKGQ